MRRGSAAEPAEVRLRVAARSADRAVADRVGREVLALYCCGPAGGGGVRRGVTSRVNPGSVPVSRERVRPTVPLVGNNDIIPPRKIPAARTPPRHARRTGETEPRAGE